MELDKIYCGDCLTIMKDWPDNFIDCCVTSPPYWGLRDYGIEGQLGLEKTPEEYIAKMVRVFREVRRVLKKTGNMWLNMGDSYARQSGPEKADTFQGRDLARYQKRKGNRPPMGLKQKDLIMMPHRLAIALQADGWWIRSDIPWVKRSAMPESCQDRPTKAVEYMFLCTKSAKYFYDLEAIRVPNRTESNAERPRMGQGPNTKYKQKRGKHKNLKARDKPHTMHVDRAAGKGEYRPETPEGRNRRNSDWWFESVGMLIYNDEIVGLDVNPQAYKEAHFATFPPKLIEPCILAGCPEWVCKKCGKARERIVDKGELVPTSVNYDKKTYLSPHEDTFDQNVARSKTHRSKMAYENTTTGWTDCKCGAGFDGGIVLDPFMGSSTTAVVAYENRRHYLGIELNQEYIDLGRIDKQKEQYALIE